MWSDDMNYMGRYRRAGRHVRRCFLNTSDEDQSLVPIVQMLKDNGLLNETTSVTEISTALSEIPTLSLIKPLEKVQHDEWLHRRALANNLKRVRSQIPEADHPDAPRQILNHALEQAASAMNQTTHAAHAKFRSPYRRALLPPVAIETFQTNRRLVDALCAKIEIKGIDRRLSEHLATGGKRGFSDVRDFFKVLNKKDLNLACDLYDKVWRLSKNQERRLLRKLFNDEAPRERDFK